MTERPDLLAGEDLPEGPRQKRSREKRGRLDAAALEVFGARGYQAASIAEIAGRAGIPVGGFYQHYRSKRQLLLALMDELIEAMARLDLRPIEAADIRAGLRDFLARAFSGDFRYLGAYRAWQEASLSDADLALLQARIRAWTMGRVTAFFLALQRLPGAREGVDAGALGRAMDGFFWNMLAEAAHSGPGELGSWIDAATQLIYHALFRDEFRAV